MAFRISRGIWQFKKEDGTYESKYKIATDGRLVTTDASGNELSTFGATAAWADITGKPSTFTPSAHTHTIANVTGLQAALDGKQASGSYAAASHTHTIANVTGLQAALDDKQVRGSYLTSESDTLATVTSRGNTTSGSINVNGNILLTGTATTTNQGRMIDFTGFDKEGTTDFSDRAYIQHTTNAGGHSGSVLIISSQNDANDGIAFETNASSKLKHNSQNIATENWVSAQGYLTSIPAHTHTIANVTGLQSALDGKQAAGAYLTNTSSETISYVYRIHASDGTSPDNFGYNNRYQTFNYGVSSGITGPLMTFGGLGDAYPMQITGAYSGGGNAFAVRTRNGDTGTWNAWRTLITDGNIGSQSVNYASSAGAVAWGNVSGKPSTFTPSSHTHAISDVTGLQTALDGKQAAGSYAAASHTHTIAQVTGLQTALDGKQASGSYAAASHTHAISDVTGLQTALDGKQAAGSYAASNHNHTYNVNDQWLRENGDNAHFKIYANTRQLVFRTDGATEYNTGVGGYPFVWMYGGDAASNRRMLMDTSGNLWTATYGWLHDYFQRAGSYAAASHTHTIANVTGLQAALDGKQAAGSYAAASHTHDDRYYTESEVNTLLAGKLNTGAKAADSETVDGIDSSRIIYGDGGFGSTSWSDMNNTAQKSGFFFYNQPTGNPFNDWTHWINSMGNSWNPNYGFQLAHAFHSDRLAVRVVANGGFSSWRTVIDSGNIGSQSVNYANTAGSAPANGGNSNTVAGLAVHGGRNNEANKVVRTDGNGYIQAGWINTTSGDNGTTAIGRIYASQDGYIRYYTPSNFISVLGLITTGNISSQSVNYASSAGDTDRIDGWNFRNTGSNSGVNADTLNSNGITYYTAGVPNFSGNSTDGALYSQAYSDSWQHQIAADYRSGQIALRGKNNGTWQGWRTVLDSSNFSAWAQPAGSYAPLNGSLGTDFYTNAIYYDDWVRNHYNSNGMYWSQTGWHLYPINGAYFRIRSGNTATSGLRFMTGSTDRNYLHCNSSNEIGFLNASGSWALRVDNSGNTTATGDVTAFSDVRLKENIRPISGALDKVLSLQGVYYNRIDIEDKSTKIGFIAQDVKHIVPEVVQISSDELSGIEDRHSVDYGKLVALLTEAIKEQQKQIDELKTIVNGITK